MEIKLLRADISDAKELHAMQVESFRELLVKYQDYETNPANEDISKIESRLSQDGSYYYFICLGQQKVGAVRVIDHKQAGKSYLYEKMGYVNTGRIKSINERLTLVYYEKT